MVRVAVTSAGSEPMTSPRVAVVIPAYNAAKTVGETLDALQANPAIGRLILVALLDDCSTDDTVDVARRHWNNEVPLEVWPNPRNMGERRTINAAMVHLSERVDWTCILHADDVVKSNWLALYIEAIEGAPHTVASVCSSYDNWWPATGLINPGEDRPGAPIVHVPGERIHVIGTINNGCWWHISGCAIRNCHFKAVGDFEPDLPQLGDWEWLLRCLAKGYGIVYLPRTTMLYRQHAGSVSSRSFREARDMRERLRILSVMQTQGYLTTSEHRAKLLATLRLLARRALVRMVRGDMAGFRAHTSLLLSAGFNYARKKASMML